MHLHAHDSRGRACARPRASASVRRRAARSGAARRGTLVLAHGEPEARDRQYCAATAASSAGAPARSRRACPPWLQAMRSSKFVESPKRYRQRGRGSIVAYARRCRPAGCASLKNASNRTCRYSSSISTWLSLMATAKTRRGDHEPAQHGEPEERALVVVARAAGERRIEREKREDGDDQHERPSAAPGTRRRRRSGSVFACQMRSARACPPTRSQIEDAAGVSASSSAEGTHPQDGRAQHGAQRPLTVSRDMRMVGEAVPARHSRSLPTASMSCSMLLEVAGDVDLGHRDRRARRSRSRCPAAPREKSPVVWLTPNPIRSVRYSPSCDRRDHLRRVAMRPPPRSGCRVPMPIWSPMRDALPVVRRPVRRA